MEKSAAKSKASYSLSSPKGGEGRGEVACLEKGFD